MNNPLDILCFVFGLIFMLFSCGSPAEKEIQELTISVDTVQIDPGEELLFLKWGLELSGLSEDQRYLFNFDVEQHQLEKIDLDCLVLERKISFEKEGPNGLNSIHSLKGWKGDLIFFSTWKGPLLFSEYGQLEQSWNVDPKEFSGDVLSEKESLMGVLIDPSAEKEAYGLAKAFRNEMVSFVRLDLDQNQIYRYSLPLLDKLGTYTASLNDGESYAYHDAETYQEIVDSGVLFGAETGSEFYHYDPKADTIKIVGSNSKWLESENKAKGHDFASAGEFSRYFQQFMEGPHYLLPVYDAQNKRYWRLFYENYYKSEKTEGLFPQPAGANVYLALYDEELNLIQEAELPFLTEKPLRHFIKDGMLWIVVNLEDEMGFVRLSVSG
ncbi:protein of unknown function [Cyclobacterium lianum]|uniref:DUF4221 domain-containing protein n=1 Tax=Cyclobacterium lianum TaxID=388280 RepID=A0A1M7KDM7_9BACT|nr:DUF4221 family protein [Cyclobacterium lianum]SHM63342.1 protein of unknown function [Cyclobacterium lianum]